MKEDDFIFKDGIKYLRATAALRPFTNFDGIPKEILEKKAIIGTNLHYLISQEIQGELPIIGLEEEGYFESFNKWRKALNPTFKESEVRYYSDKELFTGAIDAIIELKGEEKGVLVDFKTSAQESPSWIRQAHLYNYLLFEAGKTISNRCLFVKLDKYGNLPIVFQYVIDENITQEVLRAVKNRWDEEIGCVQF